MLKLRKITIPLYLTILLAMVAGLIFGTIMHSVDNAAFVQDWVKPFGDIFMQLLRAIAIPLVLVSLIRGVTNLESVSSLSKLGGRTIIIYILTTVVAIVIGLTLANVISPGKVIDPENAEIIQREWLGDAMQRGEQAEILENSSPLQWLVEIVPNNVFEAFSNNSSMLQIIFIALIIGVAMLMLGLEKVKSLSDLLEASERVIIKIVELIMKFAPIGVFALMASTVVQSAGNLQLLGALGLYFITVIIGLTILTLGVYPLMIKLFTDKPVGQFYRKMIPVQLLAFVTSSSAATLPLTLETVERDLGVSKRTASFVLPVGVTLNMDGTSIYQAIGVVFIAQVMGVELGWSEILTIIATTTISSIGTPGLPSGSVVILIMVLGSIGIPAEGLALIMGVDRPLDMLRTVTNVTGDATVSVIVDRKYQLSE